ncbi:MAG: tetratricopeptide repeat protein [Candidatus Melainabacteria bacterium]|nr:tetratricopeptide repeat protein [Candidatus Melainabacteria bacterium]
MFTFSDQEYKWCPECQGNIRKDAYYCKFCRKPVGSKLLAAKQAKNVSNLISGAARWLPNFSEILNAVPEPLRLRIEHEDAQPMPAQFGLKPEIEPPEFRSNDRNSGTCPPNQPSNAELGLVLDLLISIHAQELPLANICSDPRLKLLELTVGEIVAEYELRASEIKGGQKCTHCAEFIMNDGERCRFCTGTETEPPDASEEEQFAEINRFDATLLRNILVWEVAMRRINDEPELDAEILAKHAITDSDIDAQILKLRQKPDALPVSRWRERMVHLGISPGYYQKDQMIEFDCDFDYFALQDVTALVRALTPSYLQKSKHESPNEAMIVVDHGLRRWHLNRHFEQERHSLVSGKAMVYLSLKDDENYKKFDEEANQILMESMPPEYRGLMETTFEITKNTLVNVEHKLEPEERLKALEARASEYEKLRAEQMERMNMLAPGLGDAFKGIGDMTNRMAQIGTLTLKGQAALKNSDPQKACAEFEAAIDLLGSEVFDISRKCSLMINLAEAQFLTGDVELAEATFQRAFSDAADVVEAQYDLVSLAHAHHRYACFLRDTGNYSGAEEHFNRATAEHAQQIAHYIEKGYMAADSSTENWQIKADFAKLLRAVGRDEDAEREERESNALKEKDPKV